ncbi:hypothetical protein BT96DRAFT_996556 [Gymnopus androsaceus JB14]|uniref:Uncharacterized protein n=1 Tax=Gymnopus androsaceus JB14 TaxID=1447944 RepID=A0A6A4HFV2_9AGAR|nr:hypothetical protein BT96DRAFT_996556 [Gymnopus androsaceus JB14]
MPPSAISRMLSVPGSSLAPPAPPLSERHWGGILMPNAFRAEFGGQNHSSSALSCFLLKLLSTLVPHIPGFQNSSNDFAYQVNLSGLHLLLFAVLSKAPCLLRTLHTPRDMLSPTDSAAPAAKDTGAGSKIPMANDSGLKGTWGDLSSPVAAS